MVSISGVELLKECFVVFLRLRKRLINGLQWHRGCRICQFIIHKLPRSYSRCSRSLSSHAKRLYAVQTTQPGPLRLDCKSTSRWCFWHSLLILLRCSSFLRFRFKNCSPGDWLCPCTSTLGYILGRNWCGCAVCLQRFRRSLEILPAPPQLLSVFST